MRSMNIHRNVGKDYGICAVIKGIWKKHWPCKFYPSQNPWNRERKHDFTIAKTGVSRRTTVNNELVDFILARVHDPQFYRLQ